MSRRITAVIAMMGFVVGMFFAYQGTKDILRDEISSTSQSQIESRQNGRESSTKPTSVRLLAAGDMVFHPITYSPQYETVVPPYDFSRWFHRIKSTLDDVDYATVTFETVCDSSRSYKGYPVFNTPPEAISVIHEAGFDAYATATNHCLDQGFDAMLTTLEEMDKAGVSRFGCKREQNEAMLIEDVQGIKIAFLNYADAYNGFEKALQTNQRDLISPLEIDQVCDDIVKAREEGADIVAVYPHWGVEYQTLPNQTQMSWAHQMAEAGADVIIGSHPHVVQPAEWVENNGRKTFIVYSLGNTMSNQRAEFLGTIDTEIGAFVDLTFSKDEHGAKVETAELIPSTVYVNKQNGKPSYEVAFIDDLLQDDRLTAAEQAHIKRLKERANTILEAPLSNVETTKQTSA